MSVITTLTTSVTDISAEIDTNIDISSGIPLNVKVKAYNKTSAGSIVLSGGYIITNLVTDVSAIPYVISFDPGAEFGGTGSMNDMIVSHNSEVTLPANTFTNPSADFVEWIDSNNTVYADESTFTFDKDNTAVISGTLTLTAQWSTP